MLTLPVPTPPVMMPIAPPVSDVVIKLKLPAEVIFANIVIWFLGRNSEIEQVVGVVTILILLIHLVAAAALAIGDLVTVNRAAKEEEN